MSNPLDELKTTPWYKDAAPSAQANMEFFIHSLFEAAKQQGRDEMLEMVNYRDLIQMSDTNPTK